MSVAQYIDSINARYKAGNATEHTYRGDLQQLIERLVPGITATNEPKRQRCGAPDYILTSKDNIPVGFIEAKDIGDKDLEGAKKTGNKEQFDRYKGSLNNLIFTDYLEFHLYRDGQFVRKIAIGEVTAKGIKPLSENFAGFENFIKDFGTHVGQTIKSSHELAKMMAGKARLLAEIIEKVLISDDKSDDKSDENETLFEQMQAFKELLIHDITEKEFADVYAQTITYGLFAARLHDPTLPTFSRSEAAELIPKSNPFLRKLFSYIAGPDIDDRIKWIVDDLVTIFLACNVDEMLKNYGKATKTEDPIIHFYEDFLSEYDPSLRKARGVWYTPQPVVQFIVRAVDDILKTEFNMPQGLADTSKTTIKVKQQDKEVSQEVHKVQVLDPATGTGTFLAETIKHIHTKFAGQQGIWSNYVETHLLPRLHGFELLMASYAMAHLKLDLLLRETGYNSASQRLRVYLTNSLEQAQSDQIKIPMMQWLTEEGKQADIIKRDTPVMCVIGNPPYSGISSNNSEWISSLIEDYKYVDGVHFNERKHWLNDDYVKFLRYGQYLIEKNGSGVLAFINPHGFLDNPTFRGMRWNLLKTYDKIYTIDLHGNTKKKEKSPDGSVDENVFDIMQGVSINIFVKTGKKKSNELGKVLHYDLFGKREVKYDFLSKMPLHQIRFNELQPNSPNFFFVPKNDTGRLNYESGIRVDLLFSKNVTGIVTMGDEFAFAENKNDLVQRLNDFKNKKLTEIELKIKYNLGKNYAEFILKNKESLIIEDNKFVKCSYRPFDDRYTYFDNKILWRWRVDVMQHFLKGENIGLVFRRQQPESLDLYVFCSNKIIADGYIRSDNKGGESIVPLYVYPDSMGQQSFAQGPSRTPNLNMEIVQQIATQLGMTFTPEKEEQQEGTFAPIDLLDYIYAVLHSPSYREKYKEFLKIDFPRVPYPKDAPTFWQLVRLGGNLRQLHLLEGANVNNAVTTYPVAATNMVTAVSYRDIRHVDGRGMVGRVYINETQYFDYVPQIAWEFYIGGYQPAQKWLKDRKGRTLSYEDIVHYQKIIVALTETDTCMKEIDTISIE